jgi:NH3-dependent NAD+ synthetase
MEKMIARFSQDSRAEKLLVGLSGGVDSAVVAALAVRGFGSQSTLPTQRELQDFLERAGA